MLLSSEKSILSCRSHIWSVARVIQRTVSHSLQDEPFHVPQAEAYCRGEWSTWDSKITTPPGLYVITFFSLTLHLIWNRYLLSIGLNRIFMLKCNLAMLRLTPLLTLLALPLLLSHLRAFHIRVRAPRSLLATSLEDVVLSTFPIAWFFGFLYYTDIPSLAFVLATVVAATRGQNNLAGLVSVQRLSEQQSNRHRV